MAYAFLGLVMTLSLAITVLSAIRPPWDSGLSLAASAAALLASLVLLVLGLASSARRLGPARFQLRVVGMVPSFVVPPRRWPRVLLAASTWTMIAATLPLFVHLALTLDGLLGRALALLLIAVQVANVAVDTIGLLPISPVLVLRPDGLSARLRLGRWTATWDALAPLPPPAGKGPATPTLLAVDRPELVRRGGLWLTRARLLLPLPESAVHPWFVYDAIAFYQGHPERRAGIGTAEEHTRLRAELGAEPPESYGETYGESWSSEPAGEPSSAPAAASSRESPVEAGPS